MTRPGPTVRYEEMFPSDARRALRRFPVAYVPFGTLEWHGEHLALGNDAVKAHELLIRVANKTGGIVVPPTFWAVGGLDQPWTVVIERDGTRPSILTGLFVKIFEELARVGFKAMVAVTGHYGMGQVVLAKRAAVEAMRSCGVPIWAGPEYEFAVDFGYRGDHAGKWETSILWDLRPELVDLWKAPRRGKLVGVGGEDPRKHASRRLGAEVNTLMTKRLAALARRLVKATPAELRDFRRQAELDLAFREKELKGRVRGRPVKWNDRTASGFWGRIEAVARCDFKAAAREAQRALKSVTR